MDSSSLHSDSKCNSDFSIKRILGNDTESVREDVATPSWLCCTRYRPPRLPRTVNNTACRPRRSGRHARVPFTAAQAAALEAAYSRAPYLAPPALRALAAALQLRDDRIKIWFQNRRARERREKSSNITPPQAVTLPPTSPPSSAVVLPNRPWVPNLNVYPCETQSTKVENEPINTTARLHQTTSFAIHLLRSNTTGITNSEFESDEDRCDSPLDIETIAD
ncbi:unnamed protein product [Parnassius mnemosyne]|uniref:Homeobox domain-containing protein n=1 Tax=Parnassius mnemosyne TaxID=213953 RepID=A0AAV1KNN7_9NEOP